MTTAITHAAGFVGLLALLAACGPGSQSETETSTTSTTGTESTTETSTTQSEADTETETTTDTAEAGDVGPVECEFLTQDCPDGQKCMPVYESGSWMGSQCFGVSGTAAIGETCRGNGLSMPATDDCGQTSWCVGEVCRPFCLGAPDMPTCSDGWECKLAAEGPPICFDPCNPLTDPCSTPGQQCAWTGNEFGCITEGSMLGPGEPCRFIDDCASGFCANAAVFEDCDGGGCCAGFCNLPDGDGPCQAQNPNYVCEPFFMEAPPGYEDVGVCILPQ